LILIIVSIFISACGLLPSYPKMGKWTSGTNSGSPGNNVVLARSVTFEISTWGEIKDFSIEIVWVKKDTNELVTCRMKPQKLNTGNNHEFRYKEFNQYNLLYDLSGTNYSDSEKDDLRKSMATPIRMEPSSEFFLQFEINGKFTSPTAIEGQFSIVMCDGKIIFVDSKYGEWKAEWEPE
jgi:hypothetical protein